MSDQHDAGARSSTRNRTIPSRRAPSLDPTFRRPSDDPTLGDGAKAPTTVAWVPTPTRSDRRGLEAPALVIGHAHGEHGSGGRVAAVLEQLGRDVRLVAPGARGVPVAGDGTAYPLVVYVGSGDAVVEPDAATTDRTLAAYRPAATVVYDVATRPATMGTAEDVRGRIEARVAGADVVLVTTEDLRWLYPDDEPRDVVRRWLGTGPGIVVVSSGETVSAVNAVGVAATAPAPAGTDESSRAAFVAAVIDALWKGALLGVGSRPDLRTLVSWSLQELVDHGSAAARLTAGGGHLSRESLSDARGVPQLASSARPDGA